MRFKIIAAAIFGWLVFPPTVVLAIKSDSPLLDRTCWKRKSCWEYREKFLDTKDTIKLDEGFVTGVSAGKCIGNTTGKEEDELGKCLPAGKTNTQISFGGRAEFANVGEFILVMYKYLLAIAGILAVIVIIASGVQWTASGGNSEVISSAKKRIGGALIGLFIGYMSYFILSTINPALINLRLPQVFLIRPIALPDLALCTDQKFAGKKLALIPRTDATNQELLSGKTFNSPPSDQFFEVPNPACNYAYAVDGIADEFCFGSFPNYWNSSKENVCALSINGGIGSTPRVNYDHEVVISGIGSSLKSALLNLIGTDGRSQVGMVQEAELIFSCKEGSRVKGFTLDEEETTEWWAAQSAALIGVANTGSCVKDGIAISGSCFQHAGGFNVSEKDISEASTECSGIQGGGPEVYLFLTIRVKKESLGILSTIFSSKGAISYLKSAWDSLTGDDDPKANGWVVLGCADAGNTFKCEKIVNFGEYVSPEVSDMVPLLPILEHKALFKQIKSVFSTENI